MHFLDRSELFKKGSDPMEQKTGGEARAGKLWIRLIAAVLAMLLALSLLLANAIRISIRKAEEVSAEAAATNYLLAHTDYAHLSAWDRAKKVVSQLRVQQGKQATLEDHYEKASIAIAKGENQEALTHVDACLELIDPESSAYVELIMKQGCLRALLQDPKGAKESFAVVIERDPDYAEAWLLQTQLLIEEQDVAAAKEHLGMYLSLTEGDASQKAVMAQLCFGAGEFENCLLYGEQALTALAGEDSGHGELYRCMGYAALMTDRVDVAEGYLTAAIERIQDNAEIYYYRGIFKMAQERLEEALADYDTAIDGGYQTALAYYNRGVCHLALEDLDALKADMEKVAELNEDAELTLIAQKILKELR